VKKTVEFFGVGFDSASVSCFLYHFSPVNVPSFFRKHLTQACSFITFALSQLLIKYLSSTAI